jgi:hypothetical protein
VGKRLAITAGAWLIALAGSLAAASPIDAPALSVCLVLSPKLAISERRIAIMLSELFAIWRPNGVATSRADPSRSECDRVIMVRADHESRPEDLTRESALAWVPFVEGRARQLVFLRVERARMLIAALNPGSRGEGIIDLLHARSLGRSLAHELGHILLNSVGHERSGLMRADSGATDVLKLATSAYTLNAAERARLLTAMTSRSPVAVR